MADKKYRITHDNRKYGELEVEWENGVRLILTDAKRIYSDDWNSIKGWVVDCLDEAEAAQDIPEYLYEFSFMPDGYSLITAVVDEDVAKRIMTDNVINILHHGSSKLNNYLKELHSNLILSGKEEQGGK